MATILSFVPKTAGRQTSRQQAESATIIFFTGVRYERDARARPAAETGPTGPNAATRRKSARTPRG